MKEIIEKVKMREINIRERFKKGRRTENEGWKDDEFYRNECFALFQSRSLAWI